MRDEALEAIAYALEKRARHLLRAERGVGRPDAWSCCGRRAESKG